MVIDTSAIIAILLHEPEGATFARRIVTSPVRLMSAVSKLETSMVAIGRGGAGGLSRLDQYCANSIRCLCLRRTPGRHRARRVRALRQGRHRAGLNFGDCAAYALAIAEAEPLLFKG